ncbi:MAG TPA: hypothetical protein VF788_18085, partial [Pseudonocardiaceae bacterium]
TQAVGLVAWRVGVTGVSPRSLRLYVMIVRPVGFARFFVALACGLVACSGCAAHRVPCRAGRGLIGACLVLDRDVPASLGRFLTAMI